MRLHVIPVGDRRGDTAVYHSASARCSCHPLPEEINGHILFGHHAFDLREKWERQDVWVQDKKPWAIVEEL